MFRTTLTALLPAAALCFTAIDLCFLDGVYTYTLLSFVNAIMP
jgi:hypothetical protein